VFELLFEESEGKDSDLLYRFVKFLRGLFDSKAETLRLLIMVLQKHDDEIGERATP
jgi:hypothetical protein